MDQKKKIYKPKRRLVENVCEEIRINKSNNIPRLVRARADNILDLRTKTMRRRKDLYFNGFSFSYSKVNKKNIYIYIQYRGWNQSVSILKQPSKLD